MKEFNPHNAYDKIESIKNELSKAEGLVAGLEAKKRAIIAIMMKKSGEQSLGAQEREAYASAEFDKYCNDIDEAVAKKTLLKLFKATKNIHVINVDDENSKYFLDIPAKQIIKFGMKDAESAGMGTEGRPSDGDGDVAGCGRLCEVGGRIFAN